MPLPRMSCCNTSWVGVDRAHCCRRTGGCGHVFDDAQLWDAHRPARRCVDPYSLGLVQTTTGIWLRALESATPASQQGNWVYQELSLWLMGPEGLEAYAKRSLKKWSARTALNAVA
jgi:hypothetical protein